MENILVSKQMTPKLDDSGNPVMNGDTPMMEPAPHDALAAAIKSKLGIDGQTITAITAAKPTDGVINLTAVNMPSYFVDGTISKVTVVGTKWSNDPAENAAMWPIINSPDSSAEEISECLGKARTYTVIPHDRLSELKTSLLQIVTSFQLIDDLDDARPLLKRLNGIINELGS